MSDTKSKVKSCSGKSLQTSGRRKQNKTSKLRNDSTAKQALADIKKMWHYIQVLKRSIDKQHSQVKKLLKLGKKIMPRSKRIHPQVASLTRVKAKPND